MDIIMDVVTPIRAIYNLITKTKNNEEILSYTLERLTALEKLVLFIDQKKQVQLSDDVNEAVVKLNEVLISAAKFIEKFNGTLKLGHMLKAADYESEFENLNKSLTDAFVTLSGALHVHQEKKLAEQKNMLHEQEKKLAEQEKKLAEQEKKLAQEEKKLDEQKKLAEQVIKLAEQDNMLHKQEKKLAEQENMLQEQGKKLAEQVKLAEQLNMLQEHGKKLAQQENMLAEQLNMLQEQGKKLAEQEATLQSVESELMNDCRICNCILQ